MLDNGYVYPADTRLSLYRSHDDWGLVIEVFGFSPRAWDPDVHIYTFGSQICNRKPADRWNNPETHANYLRNNPFNESRFIHPVDLTECRPEGYSEILARPLANVYIRGEGMRVPSLETWAEHGVEMENPDEPAVYELCRVLASMERDRIFATKVERCANLPSECTLLLQLEEWNHPDVVDDDHRPGNSETFRQLAKVLVTGDLNHYRPTQPPNTHWKNWPDGGTL